MAPSVRNADAFLPSASQTHPLTFAKNLPNQFGILKTLLDAHKVISARYKAIAVLILPYRQNPRLRICQNTSFCSHGFGYERDFVIHKGGPLQTTRGPNGVSSYL